MKKDVNEYLNNIINVAPSEEMYFEAIRDIFKDLIKEYIQKRINEDEELKKQISAKS